MAGLLDHAVAFAQAILRTDAPANLRESVGGLTDLIGLLKAALRSQPQPVGDVVMKRAMCLAEGHATLRAPGRLLRRLFAGILLIDLVKILAPRLGVALMRHIAVDLSELEHRLVRHDFLQTISRRRSLGRLIS